LDSSYGTGVSKRGSATGKNQFFGSKCSFKPHNEITSDNEVMGIVSAIVQSPKLDIPKGVAVGTMKKYGNINDNILT